MQVVNKKNQEGLNIDIGDIIYTSKNCYYLVIDHSNDDDEFPFGLLSLGDFTVVDFYSRIDWKINDEIDPIGRILEVFKGDKATLLVE
jgi:hypothetical protein